MLARLLRRPRAPVHAAPPGERLYAIGDVHGCLHLLDQLLARIEADHAEREVASGAATGRLIFLGDLVDRGPDSAGVVERVRELQAAGRWRVDVLMGNHEESFLRALDDERGALRFFLKIGGRETLLSYGLSPELYPKLDYHEIGEWMRERVPAAHAEWLATLAQQVRAGDYVFVHAGVRPDVRLADQDERDLRWIRAEFLEYGADHEAMVVHGHTITEGVDERSNRIGVDTGAYATGVLSAVGFEGTARWVLQASDG